MSASLSMEDAQGVVLRTAEMLVRIPGVYGAFVLVVTEGGVALRGGHRDGCTMPAQLNRLLQDAVVMYVEVTCGGQTDGQEKAGPH